jgi:hypothetical protein
VQNARTTRAECVPTLNCMYFQAQARRSSGGLRGRGKHIARVQSILGGNQGKRFSCTHLATTEFSMRVKNVSSDSEADPLLGQ